MTGPAVPPGGSKHRRGDGASSHLCTYCCQPWPCPDIERETYGPAVPPGGEELREAVARWLYHWSGLNEDDLNDYVDDLLALPAVRDALAAQEKLRRVEALAASWTRYPQSREDRERNRYGAAMQDCGDALRRALTDHEEAGPQPEPPSGTLTG